MTDIAVGDIVRLEGDKDNTPLTVNFIHEDGNLEFVEAPFYTFPADIAVVTKKCPYKEGDKVQLTALFWRESEKNFIERKIFGTVESGGWINFNERTFDHFGIGVAHLNAVRTAEDSGNDYDCAFCEPSEENIRKAKLSYLRRLTSKVEDLKEDYEDANSQLLAMRQQIGG